MPIGMNSMYRTPEELIYAADTDVLLHILSELTKQFSTNPTKEQVKLLLELDKFVGIHRTRTHEVVTLKDKIEVARDEYRKIRAERDYYKKVSDEAHDRLQAFMQNNL